MSTLGATRFDRAVIDMSLINLCDRDSYVGQEMWKSRGDREEDNDGASANPWRDLHQFTIYVPHPDQEYEGISLEEGLTRGYNVEASVARDRSQIPYKIPEGGHFVVVLKQRKVDGDFKIAATGMFIRPLGVLSLDIIVDMNEDQFQPVVFKHPIVRDYPAGWEDKLVLFLKQEIRWQELPDIVGHVDRFHNRDYRPPSWREVYLGTNGFSGF